MHATDVQERIGIVNQTLTPKEAKDLMLQVIDDQINFEKIKNWCNWECNHGTDAHVCEEALAQLQQRRKEILAIVEEAQHSGAKLNVKGEFYISFE